MTRPAPPKLGRGSRKAHQLVYEARNSDEMQLMNRTGFQNWLVTQEIRPFLQMTPTPDAPASSVCFLRRRDYGLILYRQRTLKGPSTCRVLVGAELIASDAVRDPIGELANAGLPGERDELSLPPPWLSSRGDQEPPDEDLNLAFQVLSSLLEDPARQLAVVDAGIAERGPRVIRIVVAILDGVLAGLPWQESRCTFSTWEPHYAKWTPDHPAVAPQIVFAPAGSQSSPDRQVLPGDGEPPQRYRHAAEYLYHRWHMGGLDSFLVDTALAEMDAEDRIRNLVYRVPPRASFRRPTGGAVTIETLQGNMRCPICQDTFPWSESEVYIHDLKDAKRDLTQIVDPTNREDMRRRAFLKCPNRNQANLPTPVSDHDLPLRMASNEPIVLAFIGGSSTGKSHVMAAMAAAIELRHGLASYGVRFAPLDPKLHGEYMRSDVVPLVRKRQGIEGTNEGRNVFVAAYLVDGPGVKPRAVVFFDVSGNDLGPESPNGQFVAGASGLFYIADPGLALRIKGVEADKDDAGLALGLEDTDPTIGHAAEQFRHDAAYADKPVAILLTKADRYRFLPPVDRWMHQPTRGPLDPQRVRAESRDAYALLHSRQADTWLTPIQNHRLCTLHFVSATGCEAVRESDDGDLRFVRPIRMTRVLEPLMAMLAMTGVISVPGTGMA